MKILPPFRILIAVLGAGVCLSCQSTQGKTSDPTILVSEPELRTTVDAMASSFAGRVQVLVMKLSADTNNSEIRRRFLFMKKKTITAIETASDHPKALTSYFDLWSLAFQLELFLEQMKEDESNQENIRMMGDAMDQMIALYKSVRMEFQKTAKSFIPPDSYNEVVASVQEYVESFAISGSGGTMTRISFSETAVGSVLSPVLNMTMSPFRAMEGVGKGGDAAKDLVGVTEQFVRVAERMPEHLGWEMESLIMDVRRDVDEILTSIDEKQGSIQGTLKDIQESLATIDNIAKRAEVITGSVEQTTTTLDTTAGSIESLLDTYKDTMMTLYPPATPEEKAQRAADRAALIAANPEAVPRPFDINDYTKALVGLTQASNELQALLTEIRSTLEGEELQNVVDAAGKVTAAALDESTRTVDSLVDRLFGKIVQLLLIAFGLALLFLILSRWVIRKKPA